MTSQKKISVLIIHNSYQNKGGEDKVVESEAELLLNHGNRVEIYKRHNDEINAISKLKLFKETHWSSQTINDIRHLVYKFKPDVIHVHNTFPLISPSVYWVPNLTGIPIIQTLHNFRLLCPEAMFLREGKVCEDCLGVLPWRAILHGCYRGSTLQSAVLTSLLTFHRSLGTYQNKVSRYIALNDFCKRKFIEGGLPPQHISVKPNFFDIPYKRQNDIRSGILYVGRLSSEKGIRTLANVIKLLPEVKFSVIGTGPDRNLLSNLNNVQLFGFQDQETILNAMHRASCLVLPSIWYENFPRTLVEAFACGLPVLASRLGAMVELIQEGKTGLLFEPGNPFDLAEKIKWVNLNPKKVLYMSNEVRAEYESKYSPEVNYFQLMRIYQEALAEKIEGVNNSV